MLVRKRTETHRETATSIVEERKAQEIRLVIGNAGQTRGDGIQMGKTEDAAWEMA